ncbi:MAG: leucine--tRNA ligase [bacterium]|nr:leucine--tRNA ligase [bacterium]
MKYNYTEIEEKWQKIWADKNLFKAKYEKDKEKFFCLEMFPYPSGRIHMGHVRNYSIGDVVTRMKRMKGLNVLYTMGWDSLGLPAENAAIKHNTHPETWTLNNIEVMKKQMKRMGFSYDWDRELATCLPDYYRWNQYVFIKMYEKGLVYKKKSEVNWCPKCPTVLANEQVVDNGCWRCGTEVESKKLNQWFLKITDYADELLACHEDLKKWPSMVLAMQKNWIGKSKGAGVKFEVADSDLVMDIFTTRLDTIYGATFFALSVKHPMVQELIADNPEKDKIQEFIKQIDAENKASREQTEKKGYFTGKYAINPYSGEKIPIWLANFVLIEYGTGAIMSVPAHDERDFEFAKKYDIPIRRVIAAEKDKEYPGEVEEVYTEEGYLINSGPYNGLDSAETAIQKMGEFLDENKIGELKTIFRIRDWGVSRQRYWGTPIPMIYCDKCGIVPEAEENLPVKLPKNVDLSPEGGSSLEKHPDFVKATCPKCAGEARRETDTMDTFFDSSWYYFRYAGPSDTDVFDKEEAAKWMPANLYVGGVEHAILHLIYARFFSKVFRDLGWTKISEPFPHLLAQGMVSLDGSVMSKSKGNVVDPDSLIEKYGADTARLFILFAAPPEKGLEWSDKGIEGANRFLQRIWNIFDSHKEILTRQNNSPKISLKNPVAKKLYIKLNQTIKKVTEDIELRFHLNTAIAALMEFFNEFSSNRDILAKEAPGIMLKAFEDLLKLLSPFTPHFCSELWQQSGHEKLLDEEAWPDFDPDNISEQSVNLMIQVNGKIRDKIMVDLDAEEAAVKEIALNSEKIKQQIEGKKVIKTIFIKNKMLSIVVK